MVYKELCDHRRSVTKNELEMNVHVNYIKGMLSCYMRIVMFLMFDISIKCDLCGSYFIGKRLSKNL